MADGIQAVIFSSVKKHPIMVYFLGGFCILLLMPPIYKILLFFSPLLLSTAVCMVARIFLGPSASQYSTSSNGSIALSNNSSSNNINGEQQSSLAALQEDDALASLMYQFRTCMEPRVNTDQSRHKAPSINMAAAGSNDVGNYAAVDDQYKINESYTRKCSGHGPVEVKGEYNINSGSSTRIESDQGPCDDTRPDRAAEADHQAAARPADCDDIQSSTEPNPDLATEESARLPAPHAMEKNAVLPVRAAQYSGDRGAGGSQAASRTYRHNINTSSSSHPISQVLLAAA